MEDDEVYVKGENGHYFILNKNYFRFTADAFSKVVHERVGEYVKIRDDENNLKYDLNKIRKQRLHHPEGYYLMTNEERDEFVSVAKKQDISFKNYLDNCGIDLKKRSTIYDNSMRWIKSHLALW